jgi:hypothetical protein
MSPLRGCWHRKQLLSLPRSSQYGLALGLVLVWVLRPVLLWLNRPVVLCLKRRRLARGCVSEPTVAASSLPDGRLPLPSSLPYPHLPAGPLIVSISEPSLCRYALAVCIPELCVDSPAPDTPVVKAGQPAQPLAQEAPLAQAPPVLVKPAVPSEEGGGSAPVQIASVGKARAAAADRAAAETPTGGQPEAPMAEQAGAQRGLQRSQGGRAPDSDLPESFILAFWRALLGDSSGDFASLLSGEPATGISPVRFGG